MNTEESVEIKLTPGFNDRFIASFESSYENQEYVDFNIRTREGLIPCHRVVLISSSFVCKHMFELEPDLKEINLEIFPTTVVKALLSYIYTDKVKIKPEMLHDLLTAANFLQLEEVLFWISNRLIQYTKPNKLLGSRVMAEHLNLYSPSIALKRDIVEQFSEVMKEEEWLQLNPVEIGRLVRELDRDKGKNDTLVTAVLLWVSAGESSEPMEWLDSEKMNQMIKIIAPKWEEIDSTNIMKARKYSTFSKEFKAHDEEMNPRFYSRPRSPTEDEILARKDVGRFNARSHLAGNTQVCFPEVRAVCLYEHFKKVMRGKGLYDKKNGAESDGSQTPMEQNDMPGSSSGTDLMEDSEESEMVLKTKFEIFHQSQHLRMALAPHLLELMKLQLCSMPYLEELLSLDNSPDIQEVIDNPQVKDVLQRNLEKLQEAYRAKNAWQYETRFRLAVIGGFYDRCRSKFSRQCFITYDCKKFYRLTELPEKYYAKNAGFCQVPRGFMIAGGSMRKDADIFEGLERKYTPFTPIPNEMLVMKLVYIDNKVYCLNSHKRWSEYDNIMYHDPVDQQWHQDPAPPDTITDPLVGVIGTTIYVVYDKTKFMCYRTLKRQWILLPDVPNHGYENVLTSDGKQIFLLTDTGSHDIRFQAYNPVGNRWVQKSPPRERHRYPSIGFFNNTIWLIGGEQTKLVEEYNIEDDHWSLSELKLPYPVMEAIVLSLEVNKPTQRDLDAEPEIVAPVDPDDRYDRMSFGMF